MVMDAVLTRFALAIALAMLMLGAVLALSSANGVKRIGGLVIAGMGVMAALAALAAPQAAIVAALALSLAHLVIGASLAARLQEDYGGVEIADLDAADEQGEPPEAGA